MTPSRVHPTRSTNWQPRSSRRIPMSLRSAGVPATGDSAGRAVDQRPAPRKRKNFLGRQPLGLLFSAPYVIFVLAVLAYPLGYAVYISFHQFFFTAPGVQV